MKPVIDKEQAKRNLAYHLEQRLQELGKTRYWLAKQMETSESQIQNIVQERSVPNWAFVCNMAEVLGVPLEYFQQPIESSEKFQKAAS